MFGRKDNNQEVAATTQDAAHSPATVRSVSVAASPASPTPATTRRNHEVAQGTRRHNERDNGLRSGEERKLTVGKGLSVNGEITACDILVVEGKVEAKLADGKLLEIAESGQFRGSVEIENADIAGRYDGQLTVHGRLTVRGTGRISGMVKYGELEVVAGGQIIGEMQVVGTATQTSAAPSFKSAAKFTAMTEEDDEDAASRKAS